MNNRILHSSRICWVVAFLAILLFNSCDSDEPISSALLLEIQSKYEQLPEQSIVYSKDSTVLALYTNPTRKYNHAILGDGIEAEQLIVAVDDVIYELRLADELVFEDIRPRLFDVDGDGELEIITLRSHIENGGGIAIYKIINDQLVEYAYVPEIGQRFRWMNVVAIGDFDNDGVIELAWIETPHIGGTLKIAKITSSRLTAFSEKSEYSNHAINDRNLCLSVVVETPDNNIIYVPTQDRNAIVGFILEGSMLKEYEFISTSVDFSLPLFSQYNFENVVEDLNCIY